MVYTKEQLESIFTFAVQKAVDAFRNTEPETEEEIEGLEDGTIDAWDFADEKWEESLAEGEYSVEGITFQLLSDGVPDIKVVLDNIEVIISVGYDSYGQVTFSDESAVPDEDKEQIKEAIETSFDSIQ